MNVISRRFSCWVGRTAACSSGLLLCLSVALAHEAPKPPDRAHDPVPWTWRGWTNRPHGPLPQDPGPRGGPPDAGGPFPTLSLTERRFFNQARGVFEEVDSVQGALPGEPGKGLGPVFNGNSCAMCHGQPAPGGTSPGLTSKQSPMPNPQVPLATLDGAVNVVPSFISPTGPVREPRFIRSATSNIAPNDGSVHEIYTIRGRVDAPGCDLAQPDFEAEIAASNVIFRIPTPTFGAGLVENVSELTLQENLAATAARRAALGIAGEFNRAGTISRSPALDGRRRTSRWRSSQVRPTSSSRASRTSCSRTSASR